MDITTFDDACAAVGAGRPAGEVARQLVAAMTPAERLWCLDGDLPGLAGLRFIVAEDGYHRAPFHAGRVERIGLPGIAFADGPRGSVLGNSTCFPVPMARAATWDPDLEERVGEAIGTELRGRGANLTGAVCINLLRHPAWGRAQETYGEDPFLVGELGAALTRGLQRHVMACVKHFACNSIENARFQVDVVVDDVALHEVYLPHFRRVVEEGVASVMSAYNRVNGEWCGESAALLTDVLRDQWGFEGFVISDWVFGLRDAARSLAAGLDIEMPARMVRAENLEDALADGEIGWELVDLAVERVVGTLLRFQPVLTRPVASVSDVESRHRDLAREVARRAVVLLRNEAVEARPVLPIEPEARIAVLGRLADQVNVGDAGSSDVWDLECRTVVDGIREGFADVANDDGDDLGRAAALAGEADVALVVVGYSHRDEGEYLGDVDTLPTEVLPSADEPDVAARFEAWKVDVPAAVRPPRIAAAAMSGFGTGGDRRSLRLPDHDVELIRAVVAANPRTVVAIQSGSAVLCSEWIDAVPAVLQAWYGGAEAGPALADVLTGSTAPSGRLPFSIPADEAHLPPFDPDATSARYDRWHGWWHLQRRAQEPTFPFGFGLSYTSFTLEEVAVVAAGDRLDVTGMVSNTGDRDGSDVVQVYAELPSPDAPDRLVGFTRVDVPAGGRRPFEITVPHRRLETRVPETRSWRGPSGRHRIAVARHAGDPGAPAFDVSL